MLENLKTNKEFLEKGKKYSYNYYLIESPLDINDNFKIEGFARLYKLSDLKYDIEEEGPTKDAVQDLKSYYNKSESIKYYLLRLKIVDLVQREAENPVTNLSQILDPEIGIGVSPSNICKDILNIFSLYYSKRFKIVPNFLYSEPDENILIVKPEKIEVPSNTEGIYLTLNYNSITDLRIEQFYLVQKTLSKLHNSLKNVDDDLDMGLVLLVSTIENLSRKYGEVEEKFDENIEFYQKLKKVFKKQKYSDKIDSHLREELFQEIGNAYLNISFLRTKAKYKDFCIKFFDQRYYNEKTEVMISNLYDLRSKILHAGMSLGFIPRDQIIRYNPRNRSGKIRNYKDNDGKHPKIIRIPSYNDLLRIITGIITNSIMYLYNIKDDAEDKTRYKESDFKKRNIQVGAIKKGGFKPGSVVRLDKDLYRELDFIDLIQAKNKMNRIRKEIENINPENSLKMVEEVISHTEFSMKFFVFRQACYLKIILLKDLNRNNKCLEMFEKFQINEINEENFYIFNTKAYCHAIQGNFEDAHQIIDEVLAIPTLSIEHKANYLDSKGEFYELEGNYQKAIELYNESFSLKGDSPFEFHAETVEKLQNCKEKMHGENG